MQGIVRLETRHVFIDTSIFVASNFHYESSPFKQLITLARENYLSIYLTPITIREVKAKIHDRVAAAHHALQKCRKEAMVLRHLPNDTYKELFTEFDAAKAEQSIISRFDTFISETRATIVPVGGTSVERVFDQYFTSFPPFGPGKKKNEFPDAFALAALDEWCNSKNKKIYVISSDTDMQSACEKHQGFIGLESLAAFLSIVATDNKILADFAEAAFEHLQPEITTRITKQFGWLGFVVDDEDGEIDCIEAKEANVIEHYLINVSDTDATFRLEVSVDYSADVTYYDPDSGIYDREERAMLYRETIDETVERTVELTVDLNISFPRIGDPWLASLDRVRFDTSDIYVSIHEGKEWK